MRSAIKYLPEIKRRIKRVGGYVLMLDFDGTLSSIALTPDLAKLPKQTCKLLRQLCVRVPVVIVSGRSLMEVKKKIMIKGLIYAGNHGLEWDMGMGRRQQRIPVLAVCMLRRLKLQLSKLQPMFNGMLIEDKKMSLAVHYRLVQPSRQRALQRQVKILFKKMILGKLLRIVYGKKVIEFRVNISWTKGDLAVFILRKLRKRYGKLLLAIYIGDDTTDEDVFKKIRDGITVRVGRKSKSKAGYYLDTQRQVFNFITNLKI